MLLYNKYSRVYLLYQMKKRDRKWFYFNKQFLETLWKNEKVTNFCECQHRYSHWWTSRRGGEPPRGGSDVCREQALARNDEDSLNGLEVMSSTMAFGLVLQTLSLLDATHKSTQDEVFTLVAIATAEFTFVCSVVSIVI